MDQQNNLYEILNCNENSTLEDLRKSYHKLLKIYHPDKDKNTNSVHFLNIQNAWEILSDSEKRKQYNARIFQNKLTDQSLIYSTLTLDEMELNSDANLYHYQCRCGGIYEISKQEIDENTGNTLFNCNECSLAIIVKL